jgi:hypothetical protein
MRPAKELEAIHKENELRFQVIDQNNDNSSDEEELKTETITKPPETINLLYEFM